MEKVWHDVNIEKTLQGNIIDFGENNTCNVVHVKGPFVCIYMRRKRIHSHCIELKTRKQLAHLFMCEILGLCLALCFLNNSKD